MGRRLAAPDHRRPRDADRAGDLQGRRAAREEAREAEAGGMTDWFAERRRARATTSRPARTSSRRRSRRPSTSSSRSQRGGASSWRSAPAGSRCRSPARGVRVAGIDSRRRWSRSCGGSRPRSRSRSATTDDDARRRDVLARLPRLQLDQQPDDAGGAGRGFENAAAHLEPGGCFVDRGRRSDNRQRLEVFDLSDTHVGVDEFDVDTQRLVSHHFSLRDGEWERAPASSAPSLPRSST